MHAGGGDDDRFYGGDGDDALYTGEGYNRWFYGAALRPAAPRARRSPLVCRTRHNRAATNRY